MWRVVPSLVLQNKASIDTLLYRSRNVIGLLFGSYIRAASYLPFHEVRSQLGSHFLHLVGGHWRGQVANYFDMRYDEFLYSRAERLNPLL